MARSQRARERALTDDGEVKVQIEIHRVVSCLIASLAYSGLCLSLLRAGELCVIVTDPSAAVVPRATVSVVHRSTGLGEVALTGAEGRICFSSLPAGSYVVRAELGELGPAVAEAELREDEQQQIALQLGLPKLTQQISVTASPGVQMTQEIGKALDVVEPADIARRAEYSLVEAIRLLPGVRVQQLGGPGALMNLRFRGMRVYDSGVLMDGFRFRDPAAPQGDATGLLAELVVTTPSRLEVLRGSGSSLYGSHATGGVLNVVTLAGGGSWRGGVDLEGGSLGFLRGTLRSTGSALQNRLGLNTGFTHLNVLEGLDGADRARNHSGLIATQWAPGARSRLTGRLWAARSYVDLNDSPFAAPSERLPLEGVVPARALSPDAFERLQRGLPFDWGSATFAPGPNDPDSSRVARVVSAATMLSYQLASRTALQMAYQLQTSQRDHRDGPAGIRFEPLFTNSARYAGRTDIARTNIDAGLGRAHTLTAGYEFERERYESRSADENPDPRARVLAVAQVVQHSHSGFVHHQIRWLDGRFQLGLSGRFQGFRLEVPQFQGGLAPYQRIRPAAPPTAYTGDIALAYFAAGTQTKWRVHAGNAYRAPSLYERFGTSFFFGAFSPFGDPQLRPERALSLDGGFDQYLRGARLRLSATAFYSRLQEVILFEFGGRINPATDPYGRFGGYLNGKGGLARGVESSIEARLQPDFQFNLNYTYVSTLEASPATVDGSLKRLGISDHMLGLFVRKSFATRWELVVDTFLASSYLFPFYTELGNRAFEFQGPRKTDLVASYTRPLSENRRLRAYVRIENVFNHTYYESGFRTPGRWAVGGLTLEF